MIGVAAAFSFQLSAFSHQHQPAKDHGRLIADG